jgi:serine/threonine protein kinase
MAEVFVGRSEGAHGFQKTVAIKRILPRYSGDQQFINMMVDEAKISVLLNHPNVAQVYEFGEQEGDYFIVMEYVPGQSLSKLVKRILRAGGQMQPLEASFIVVEILQGLHAAHVQRDAQGRPANIIHRDVSPQNVLLSYDGHVKLIDFGIAKAKRRLERTEVGTIKGKLRYLAPEMVDPRRFADGVDFDHRVDIFAAGIVLYEIIAGRMLFSGETEHDVYRAITDDEIPDLAIEGYCDQGLMDILQKALARHAKDRYPTAEAFADDLRAYVYRTDPSFTRRRVAEHMQREFHDEMEENDRLDAAGGEGDVGDAPREVTFIASPDAVERTKMGRKSSARRTNSGHESTGVRLAAARSSSSDAMAAALPRVNPSAETQVVDAAMLAALEAKAGAKAPINERSRSQISNARASTPDVTAFVVEVPLSDFKNSGGTTRAPANEAETRAGSSPSLVTARVRTTGSVEPREREDETGLTPATSRHRPSDGRTRWAAVIALACVVGILTAFGLYVVVDGLKTGPNTVVSTPASSSGKVQFLVDATPQGALVEWLGRPDGAVELPTVFDAEPGEEAVLRFTAKGYARLERKVTIPTDDDRPRLSVTLEAEPVPLRIDVTPKNATVTVDGKPVADIDDVAPSRPITIVAFAPGHVRKEVMFSAEPGVPLTVTMTLDEEPDAPTKTPKKPTPNKPSPVKKGKPGKLTITSMPYWGRVTVDGRTLDDTTPVTVSLPAGTYEVVVEHPPQRLMKKLTVEVEAGKTVKRSVSF